MLQFIPEEFSNLSPSTLTIITTYRCNAACKECCFECKPTVKGRLSLAEIKDYIKQAFLAYSNLELVVFTGGECFLLRDDLFSSIKYASDLGLITRCVTNGFWGKDLTSAEEIGRKLVWSGLTEINFSTGVDHLEWVPLSSVANASLVAVNSGIKTLVTVEKDSVESRCFEEVQKNKTITKLSQSSLFGIQSNTWMPFHSDFKQRNDITRSKVHLKTGCTQLFNNSVVTPHNLLAACCGLTIEHIPEMKLGDLHQYSIRELYKSQFEDFLKIWIHTDGPYNIIEKLMGAGYLEKKYGHINHSCQACVYLHQDPNIISKLESEFQHHLSSVIGKLYLKENIRKASLKFKDI